MLINYHWIWLIFLTAEPTENLIKIDLVRKVDEKTLHFFIKEKGDALKGLSARLIIITENGENKDEINVPATFDKNLVEVTQILEELLSGKNTYILRFYKKDGTEDPKFYGMIEIDFKGKYIWRHPSLSGLTSY